MYCSIQYFCQIKMLLSTLGSLYEFKVSYPATQPFTFTIQFTDGLNKMPQRKLLDIEKEEFIPAYTRTYAIVRILYTLSLSISIFFFPMIALYSRFAPNVDRVINISVSQLIYLTCSSIPRCKHMTMRSPSSQRLMFNTPYTSSVCISEFQLKQYELSYTVSVYSLRRCMPHTG